MSDFPVMFAFALLCTGCAGLCCAREVEPEMPGNGIEARADERERMVRTQIEAQGIKAPAVLEAMREVPRHLFVPELQRDHAYEDRPLSIGHNQTISQPFIVALMTELARLEPGGRVLEVGTGSGYQDAVLQKMGLIVFTIEIIPELSQRAKETLDALGLSDIHYRVGDGYRGWPEAAPFDAIIVTAAPVEVPPPLIEQLRIGGRLVTPIGDMQQSLIVITRTEEGTLREEIAPVRFVPMTGESRRSPP